jgi:thiamine-phosphate pyrophosphorylase
MEIFHVHKPLFSGEEIQNYIHQIPSQYHHKITLHSNHLKFHSLKELEVCKEKFDYAFLSPIFDSISKAGYKSTFNLDEVKSFLQKRKKYFNQCHAERSRSILLNDKKDFSAALEMTDRRALIALGGIDENKIEIACELGFEGVAVLGALWTNKNPVEKFKQLLKICNACPSIKSKNYA